LFADYSIRQKAHETHAIIMSFGWPWAAVEMVNDKSDIHFYLWLIYVCKAQSFIVDELHK